MTTSARLSRSGFPRMRHSRSTCVSAIPMSAAPWTNRTGLGTPIPDSRFTPVRRTRLLLHSRRRPSARTHGAMAAGRFWRPCRPSRESGSANRFSSRWWSRDWTATTAISMTWRSAPSRPPTRRSREPSCPATDPRSRSRRARSASPRRGSRSRPARPPWRSVSSISTARAPGWSDPSRRPSRCALRATPAGRKTRSAWTRLKHTGRRRWSSRAVANCSTTWRWRFWIRIADRYPCGCRSHSCRAPWRRFR